MHCLFLLLYWRFTSGIFALSDAVVLVSKNNCEWAQWKTELWKNVSPSHFNLWHWFNARSNRKPWIFFRCVNRPVHVLLGHVWIVPVATPSDSASIAYMQFFVTPLNCTFSKSTDKSNVFVKNYYPFCHPVCNFVKLGFVETYSSYRIYDCT